MSDSLKLIQDRIEDPDVYNVIISRTRIKGVPRYYVYSNSHNHGVEEGWHDSLTTAIEIALTPRDEAGLPPAKPKRWPSTGAVERVKNSNSSDELDLEDLLS